MNEKSKMLRRCWVQHIGIQIDFTVCELKPKIMFDNIRRDQSNCSKEGFLSNKRPQEADCQKGCVFLQSCSMHFDIYYNVNKKHENASCKYPHAFRGTSGSSQLRTFRYQLPQRNTRTKTPLKKEPLRLTVSNEWQKLTGNLNMAWCKCRILVLRTWTHAASTAGVLSIRNVANNSF